MDNDALVGKWSLLRVILDCAWFSLDGELNAEHSEDGTWRLYETTVFRTCGLWLWWFAVRMRVSRNEIFTLINFVSQPLTAIEHLSLFLLVLKRLHVKKLQINLMKFWVVLLFFQILKSVNIRAGDPRSAAHHLYVELITLQVTLSCYTSLQDL